MDIDGIRPAARRQSRPNTDGIRPSLHSSGVRPRSSSVFPSGMFGASTAPRRPVAHVPPSAKLARAVASKPARNTTITPSHKPPATPATTDGAAGQLQLPRYYAPPRPEKVVRKRRFGRTLQVIAVMLVVVLTMGGFLSWKAYSKLHKVFHGTTTVAALASKPITPDLLKGEGDGRVNILLLGIGGPGHDGPDLTDTIVVLSVDPVNNTAAMLSVPRDLWVNQPVNYFGKQQKINAAYESAKYHYLGKLDSSNANANAVQAGFNNLDQVLKQVLGISVNYHVLVNFQAFKQAVDTVGGVTVNVPTALVDPTMAWENHWNPVLAPAGLQQMNGTQALLYARSRETSSDFARGERQRQILVALKDKVFTLGTLSNPVKIDSLMDAFGDNVYSDLSTQGALRLYSIMKHISDGNVASLGLSEPPHQLVTTDHVGNTSVDRPIAGFYNYTAIQEYVRSQLPDGYIVKEHAPIVVMAPTTAGAEATAALLKSYGYNVVATAITDQTLSTATVVDLSHGKDPFTSHYLQARFNVTAATELPAGVSLPVSDAKFVIMVSK
ncbi:MAG TPA: LCP family protein [Candidatus Saccharimonadales bacterium]|nr:LCP family protein [Candidatus Saccharimonadales bacterium]